MNIMGHVDYAALEHIGHELLVALDQDLSDENLVDTPRRFAAFWKEFIEYSPGTVDATFESIVSDQLVVVSGMRVYSVCSHHLLPFWCDVSIGYLSSTRVLGLSKFARVAHFAAHRPQLQERMVNEIADAIQALTGSEDVAVLGRGVHMCMLMRGIKTEGVMTTSIMRGKFRGEADLRQEFLSLATK